MLLLDIDNTLSPALHSSEPFDVPSLEVEAWNFQVRVPLFLVDFLRSRDDIVLLSTWGKAARHFAQAVEFEARIAVMEDFTDKLGSEGKFEVVKRLLPAGWADDHIKPAMAREAAALGVATVIPQQGYITEAELKSFLQAAALSAHHAPTSAEGLLRASSQA